MGLLDKFKGNNKADNLPDIPDLPPLTNPAATPPQPAAIPNYPPAQGVTTPQLTGTDPSQFPETPPFRPLSPPPASAMPEPPAPPAPDNFSGDLSIPAEESLTPMPTSPLNPSEGTNQIALLTEDVEKIAEGLVAEKWDKISGEVTTLQEWKKNIEKQLITLKEDIEHMDTKLSNAQNAIIVKVDDYNASLKDVNIELKAMGKVFEKIVPTFTENVKKLNTLVDRAKSAKKTSKK